MSKRNSDGDVLTNRLSLGLAKHQKLLSSWLGPSTSPGTPLESGSTPREEQEEEHEQNFGHDRLGVGGITPKDIKNGSFTKRAPTSNDKLLETLLGKKKAKAHIAAKQLPVRPSNQQQQRSRYGRPMPVKEDSEDEEEGRAAAFKSKKRRPNPKTVAVDGTDEEQEGMAGEVTRMEEDEKTEALPVKEVEVEVDKEDEELAPQPKSMPSRSKAKPKSYLDEILAERASKKKKKKGKSNAQTEA